MLREPIKWFLGKAAITNVGIFNKAWSFYQDVPQTVMIEQGMPIADHKQWEAWQLTRWRRILTELGQTGLGNLEADHDTNSLLYFKSVDEITRREAKQSGIEPSAHLNRYNQLPIDIASALGLSPDNYRVLSWGYRNMSKQVPGTNGEREIWGHVVREVAPVL